MDDPVSQTAEKPPGDIRMCLRKGSIRPIGKLTHLAQIEHAGFHELGICGELCIVRILAVPQDLFSIGSQLLDNDLIFHRR